MSLELPTAQLLARRMLERAGSASDGREAPDPVTAAEAVSRTLAAELSRRFGPYGYHALLSRALVRARVDHPVLAAVRIRAELEPALDGLVDGAQAHGVEAVTEGMAAVLTNVIELLGRVIGEDMAVSLVNQAIPATTRDDVDATTRGGAR